MHVFTDVRKHKKQKIQTFQCVTNAVNRHGLSEVMSLATSSHSPPVSTFRVPSSKI